MSGVEVETVGQDCATEPRCGGCWTCLQMQHACEDCGAGIGETCRPDCTGLVSALNEVEDATTATAVTCFHCDRHIVYAVQSGWIDPEATDDGSAWRETCDGYRTEHEPKQAGLGVGHIWTAVACPAYRTTNPGDCTCRNAR